MSISRNATLQEIESYGSSVQVDISDSMSKIMQSTKCIDLGQTGTCLAELSHTSNNITKARTWGYFILFAKIEFLHNIYLSSI